MRRCARWWGRGSVPLRRAAPLLLILVLVLLQLLVAGPLLPGATRLEGEGPAASVAFSVISIEPEENSRPWGASFRRPAPEEEEEEMEEEMARAYEDENEMLLKQVNYT